MTVTIIVSIIIFTILLLLPWLGGLYLIKLNFAYSQELMQDQVHRLVELREENAKLRAETSDLQKHVNNLNLSLQNAMLENAALGMRNDAGKDSTG